MLRKEGRESKNEPESDRERSVGTKALRQFSICPFCPRTEKDGAQDNFSKRNRLFVCFIAPSVKAAVSM